MAQQVAQENQGNNDDPMTLVLAAMLTLFHDRNKENANAQEVLDLMVEEGVQITLQSVQDNLAALAANSTLVSCDNRFRLHRSLQNPQRLDHLVQLREAIPENQ